METIRERKLAGTGDIDLFVITNAVTDPEAVVVVVHGLAEHCGRYNDVAAQLNRMNYTVYRFDHRGHGISGGERGYVDNFQDLIEDADAVVALAASENPGVPIFMLGHSMGGFITAAYAINYPDKLAGQILSGAAVILQPAMEPLKELDFNAMARQMVPNSLSAQICRDPQVVRAYDEDPLVLKEFAFKLVGEVFIKGALWLMESMPAYRYPCLILHGGADQIVTPEASRYMHNHIGADDKTLRIYDGLYHEILNEPEKERVIADICQWISARIH